jgi:hypothetical protein
MAKSEPKDSFYGFCFDGDKDKFERVSQDVVQRLKESVNTAEAEVWSDDDWLYLNLPALKLCTGMSELPKQRWWGGRDKLPSGLVQRFPIMPLS